MNDATYTDAVIDSPPTIVLPLGYINRAVESLHPAYFALVMATGIISIDCQLSGLVELARWLFLINLAAYAVLWILYIARFMWFTVRFIADLSAHARAFGFFTAVAATSVLGSQCLLLTHNIYLSTALFWTALLLWLVLTYSIFVFLIVRREKPAFESSINSGWLVAVVATQSLCVLGSQLKLQVFGDADSSALLFLSFWLFGGMLYLWLIALIFYRYMFFQFEPSDLIPPYWINMGAMAISTVAGVELINAAATSELLKNLLPFLKGVTLLYWATATWWIPMLLVLGIWRHGVRRFRFRYDPLYWGLVFPLGMYSVCTLKLSVLLNMPKLLNLSQCFLVLGLVAWQTTFLSMGQRPLFALVLLWKVMRSRFIKGGKIDAS